MMSGLEKMIPFAIYALMTICIIWAIGAVCFKSIFHAALSLTAVLIGIAGIYITLHAEFLAIVQVLVYVGAVMTVVIFAIMLTERLTDQTITAKNQQSPIAILCGIGFLYLYIRVINSTPWPMRTETDISITLQNTKRIGQALLGPYAFPFEVLAVILTAVLIGAVVIAKKESKDA